MKRKKIVAFVLMTCIFNLSVLEVFANQPSFSFYPSSGIVSNMEDGFTVDVLIDSAGYDVSKARITVKFDPNVVQLKGALRNNSLFEQWPTDESTTDNQNGIVMLTGSTPSGGTYYKSKTSPDVFARLEFDVKNEKASKVVLSYEYNGKVELFKTFILNTSATPQNILLTQPSSATFSLEEVKTPSTGIDTNTLGIILGVILILVGGFVRGSSVSIGKKRRGTIVLEE